jgi:hypothetical protein
MGDDPVALSLHADVRADLAGTGIGLGRGASKLDGICAGQVRLGLTCRWRAHDHSFCRIPVTARTQTGVVAQLPGRSLSGNSRVAVVLRSVVQAQYCYPWKNRGPAPAPGR